MYGPCPRGGVEFSRTAINRTDSVIPVPLQYHGLRYVATRLDDVCPISPPKCDAIFRRTKKDLIELDEVGPRTASTIDDDLQDVFETLSIVTMVVE